MSRFFDSKMLADNVTLIWGQAREQCYLIEGSERALLIDGLTGVGSLKAYVRELTDRPVLLALTHGHLDHSGAAWEYKEAFIHPDDVALMYTDRFSAETERYRYIKARNPHSTVTMVDVVPRCAVKTYPLREGDIFDLGGVQIEAISVPGHTRGTMAILDRAARVLYSGDAVNANTLLCLPGSCSVSEYLGSLMHLKTYQNAFDVMYGGHGESPVPASIVDDGIAMCRRIIAGTDEKVQVANDWNKNAYLGSARGKNYLPVCGGYCNIMYTKDGIFPKARPVITDGPVIG